MRNAVLFDMDGLIFDTERLYQQSWQFAANRQNLILDETLYQRFIGVPDSECERILGQHFAEKINLAQFRRDRNKHYQRLRKQGIEFKPGFAALFTAIKQRGVKVAIVTSSMLADVRANFADSHYLDEVDLIISAENVVRGKPHPDCYLLACAKLALNPSDCLVLEDSNNGAIAALEAGCDVVMIPDLVAPTPELLTQLTLRTRLDEVIPLI